MSESENKEKLLQTLESIDGTLKRLEQSICGKKSVVTTPNSSKVVQMLEGQMELISSMSRKEDVTPEQVMARVLKVAEQTISSLNTKVLEMQPKADYFDELVDRNLLTNFRDAAKELGVKEGFFINWLLEKNYIYRDYKGKLQPYAASMDKGLFEIKEFSSRYSNHAGTQTLVTPKGRETFRLLLGKENRKGGVA